MINVRASKRPSVGTSGAFDAQAFLDSAGVSRQVVRFASSAILFAQGAQANTVFYLQSGRVKLSVLSSAGKEAVVAILGPGDFFGEGCLAGQPLVRSAEEANRAAMAAKHESN